VKSVSEPTKPSTAPNLSKDRDMIERDNPSFCDGFIKFTFLLEVLSHQQIICILLLLDGLTISKDRFNFFFILFDCEDISKY
jgi:hypothetical protein